MTEMTSNLGGDGGDRSGGGRIEPIELQTSMQRSYIDYAMTVIVGRALPDVRDGLKPVHRRILYAMYDGGYRPDRGFSKCSRVVGDVMGQYHPHGDPSKPRKDAPSALNEVIIPNVNLPKVSLYVGREWRIGPWEVVLGSGEGWIRIYED